MSFLLSLSPLSVIAAALVMLVIVASFAVGIYFFRKPQHACTPHRECDHDRVRESTHAGTGNYGSDCDFSYWECIDCPKEEKFPFGGALN